MKQKSVSFIFVLIFIILPLSLYPQEKDPFQVMLEKLGLNEKNLGFRPKGYWTRYPDPQDIPYKLLAFDDLMAEPQRIYDFVRNMGLAAEDFLHPEYLKKNSNSLLKITFYTGIRNITSQFRAYSASLWAELDEKEPLLAAVKEIYTKTHRVYRYNAMNQASDFPIIEKDLREAIKPIDMEIRKEIAKTLLNLLEAYRFQQIAMRNVDYEDAVNCWRIRRLGETQFDALEYYPQMEDCAKNIDMNSIYFAGYKLLESGERLADALTGLKKNSSINWKTQNLNIETPIGRIVLGGSEDNIHSYSDALMVIDFGGNDTYKGSVGANPSLNIPVSLAVDINGDDNYINEDEYLPSQGAGVFGAGVLIDVKGKDTYSSKRLSQGAAMFGIGVLADFEGNDTYEMWTSGQGGAYFGVGVAVDGTGDDKYRLWGDGQGYGGVGGVGALVNRTGKDHYRCEPLAENVYRPDYHSKDSKLNYSYAQGCGVGRRGDVTDGHSWAGGMGTIIDIEGDDIYESANWSLGCGYWYGMGFVYEGGGNDTYKSAGWTQASGAHFCIGALFDEGGSDKHIVWEEQSNGLGFGHDYTVALLVNKGGDDFYKLKGEGLSRAINMSQVFFIDTDGNDTYITGGKSSNYGENNSNISPPQIESFYHLFSDQISLFADINGKDTYKVLNFETGAETTDTRMKDGSEKFAPEDLDKFANKRYFGLGIDFLNWTGPEIEYFRDKMRKKY